MQIKLKLKPGQRGTKKLLEKYGDKLICVRYRYDIKTCKRYKTAEIIIEEVPWKPKRKKPPPQKAGNQNKIVGIHLQYQEIELRDTVKKAGGFWNPAEKIWELPYHRVVNLGLKDRIVKE